jgi:PKHD-type hydroxylase
MHFDFGVKSLPNYADFVIYDNFFLPHETQKILALWDNEQSIKATVDGEQAYKDELRQSTVHFLENNETHQWIYDRLSMLAQTTNAQRFGFELNGFYQELQLTRYTENDFFEWHMDFGANEIAHRKLSLTVQLSEPDEYEGGDLQFMVNQNIVSAPRTKGTVIVFPSFVMHRVTPITSGTRHSIVGWAAGPPYR